MLNVSDFKCGYNDYFTKDLAVGLSFLQQYDPFLIGVFWHIFFKSCAILAAYTFFVLYFTVSQKQSKLLLAQLCKIFTNFNNFWHKKWPRRYYYVRCTHLPPRLIYINALRCETQMLQIVTLRGDYLYHQFDKRCYVV